MVPRINYCSTCREGTSTDQIRTINTRKSMDTEKDRRDSQGMIDSEAVTVYLNIVFNHFVPGKNPGWANVSVPSLLSYICIRTLVQQ